MTAAIVIVLALLAGLLLPVAAQEGDPFALFDPAERSLILAHGPWPPETAPDPGNRVSGDPAAIALGARLFADTGLSPDGSFSCATCHRPESGLADGLAVGQGRVALDRNTPDLWDLRFQRWFGWDGASDSLWAASLRAMTSPREMAAAPQTVRAALAADPAVQVAFRNLFGSEPAALPAEDAMVLAAKAIAAYLETLVSPRTPFDRFRDALAAGDRAAGRDYPAAARRGLKLFVGAGRCTLCHFGPTFSNGEFADIGIPFFLAGRAGGGRGAGPGVDRGRYGGIQALRRSPFSLAGRYNDDPGRGNAWATEGVGLEHRNFGEFKVPSLRGLSGTAPYMHNGSIPDLDGVVRHYSDLDPARLHTDGEAILRPLALSPTEIDDLTAFLRSLDPPGKGAGRD